MLIHEWSNFQGNFLVKWDSSPLVKGTLAKIDTKISGYEQWHCYAIEIMWTLAYFICAWFLKFLFNTYSNISYSYLIFVGLTINYWKNVYILFLTMPVYSSFNLCFVVLVSSDTSTWWFLCVHVCVCVCVFKSSYSLGFIYSNFWVLKFLIKSHREDFHLILSETWLDN